MASTVLRKDYSGSGNRQRQTISVWVKKTLNGGNSVIFSVRHTGNSNYYGFLRFKTDDSLQYFTNTPSVNIRTNRSFRDVNGWMHIVIATDTTQSTEADRVKMYVNGVQETSLNTATYPSQNGEVTFGDNYRHEIGSYDGSNFFDGCLSHFHFITNTTYQASTFGSTDSVTGEWQINTSPSVTYATNSFFLLKDGNSVTDQSGQSNNYTVAGGTLTKTEDNPSNVFATLNPLSSNTSTTLSKGNTQVDYGGSAQSSRGTLGFSSGKFYWEIKTSAVGSGYPMVGIGDMDKIEMQVPNQQSYPGGFANSYGIIGDGRVYANGSNTGSQGFTYTTNDIIGIAVDLDSGTKTIKWFKNGSQIATYNITNTATFSVIDYSNASSDQLQYNFGNGYFGTTAVSSNSGNGYSATGSLGIFQYQPPTGYTALCTKGLNL